MKLTARRLRRLIKETINEADGTSGTRGGVAVPGSSDRYSQNTCSDMDMAVVKIDNQGRFIKL